MNEENKELAGLVFATVAIVVILILIVAGVYSYAHFSHPKEEVRLDTSHFLKTGTTTSKTLYFPKEDFALYLTWCNSPTAGLSFEEYKECERLKDITQ